jgi:hypothetical protein
MAEIGVYLCTNDGLTECFPSRLAASALTCNWCGLAALNDPALTREKPRYALDTQRSH